jgi:mRNA interferase MazF
MTDFERWGVVTALFPCTDAPVRKPRPVLVLSHGDFNRLHRHVVGCMITTGAGSHWPTDHRIADLVATGLAQSSLVRWKLFTLPATLLGRRIGTLAERDRDVVAAIMNSVLGPR